MTTTATRTVTIRATLPYRPPHLDCCAVGSVEVRCDVNDIDDDAVLIDHTHSEDCDVWRYIP